MLNMQCMLGDPRDEYVVSSLYCEHPSENTEAKKQASVTMCEFSFCVEAIMFTKLSGLLLYGQKKLGCQRERVSTADLNFDSFGASLGSRWILLYSGHLGSRHTVEKYLVYMGTCSC